MKPVHRTNTRLFRTEKFAMNFFAMAARLTAYPFLDLEGEIDGEILGQDPIEYYPSEGILPEWRKAAEDAEALARTVPFVMPPEFWAKLQEAGAYPKPPRQFLGEAAGRMPEEYEPASLTAILVATITDHVALAEGFSALVVKTSELKSNVDDNIDTLGAQLSTRNVDEAFRGNLTERIAELTERLEAIINKGTSARPTEKFFGMIGEIPTFASEKES